MSRLGHIVITGKGKGRAAGASYFAKWFSNYAENVTVRFKSVSSLTSTIASPTPRQLKR